ncbi:MAG: hypothetical protein PWQ82_1841 [Thermosediminibacterales bacterium]|nr:hypothetical protein [Thermosediminibacterales bacterium]
MAAYLITYDLNTPGKDYSELYEAIKKSCSYYCHYLDSVWIVKSSLSPEEIFDNIHPKMDKNDYLLIIEVKNNKQGWLPKEAWDCLNNHIFT